MNKLFTLLLMGMTAFGANAANPHSSTMVPVHMKTEQGVNLDFTLINKTGYTIEHIYVAPTSQRNWGDNIMGKQLLLNGESVDISFDSQETAKKWDIYVTWEGYEADEDVYWVGFDLSEISEITLYYNAETGKTTAKTK